MFRHSERAKIKRVTIVTIVTLALSGCGVMEFSNAKSWMGEVNKVESVVAVAKATESWDGFRKPISGTVTVDPNITDAQILQLQEVSCAGSVGENTVDTISIVVNPEDRKRATFNVNVENTFCIRVGDMERVLKLYDLTVEPLNAAIRSSSYGSKIFFSVNNEDIFYNIVNNFEEYFGNDFAEKYNSIDVRLVGGLSNMDVVHSLEIQNLAELDSVRETFVTLDKDKVEKMRFREGEFTKLEMKTE
jgi:hypothetical protein